MEDPKQVQKENGGEASPHSREEGIEDLYGGLQKVPLRVLDLVIWLCIVALVLVIALGVLNR